MQAWRKGVDLNISRDPISPSNCAHIVEEDIDNVINDMPCHHLIKVLGQ